MVDPKRRKQVEEILQQISSEHKVSILYACESGSRAWGFPSRDSDYDVRFIYAHPAEWYLSVDLESRKDTIDLPIDDLMDVGGWDLRKAIQLMRKSNGPLLEWLDSPIVYFVKQTFLSDLKRLAWKCYSPIACGYHYLSMAKKSSESILNVEKVKLKKCFYVLRALFAAGWIEKKTTPIPTQFAKMLIPEIAPQALLNEIQSLLVAKENSVESDFIESIPLVTSFVEQELSRLESIDFSHGCKDYDLDEINHFFRKWIAD